MLSPRLLHVIEVGRTLAAVMLVACKGKPEINISKLKHNMHLYQCQLNELMARPEVGRTHDSAELCDAIQAAIQDVQKLLSQNPTRIQKEQIAQTFQEFDKALTAAARKAQK